MISFVVRRVAGGERTRQEQWRHAVYGAMSSMHPPTPWLDGHSATANQSRTHLGITARLAADVAGRVCQLGRVATAAAAASIGIRGGHCELRGVVPSRARTRTRTRARVRGCRELGITPPRGPTGPHASGVWPAMEDGGRGIDLPGADLCVPVDTRGRSTTHEWRSIEFPLLVCTYVPWGVRVGKLTKPTALPPHASFCRVAFTYRLGCAPPCLVNAALVPLARGCA